MKEYLKAIDAKADKVTLDFINWSNKSSISKNTLFKYATGQRNTIQDGQLINFSQAELTKATKSLKRTIFAKGTGGILSLPIPAPVPICMVCYGLAKLSWTNLKIHAQASTALSQTSPEIQQILSELTQHNKNLIDEGRMEELMGIPAQDHLDLSMEELIENYTTLANTYQQTL